MKHQIPDEIIRTAELLPLIEKPARRSAYERLELWAKALDRHDGPLSPLRRLEHMPIDELRAYRRGNSPLTVAFSDPLLRSEGLSGGTLGDVMDFFELNEKDTHSLLCDCHFEGTMTAGGLARRIRHHARWSDRRARWIGAIRRLFRRSG